MSIDVKKQEIEVAGTVYEIEEDEDYYRNPQEYLKLTVEEFPGLEATLGQEYDQEFANPRDWSNVGRMAVCYKGYSLGDEDEALTDGQSFEVECKDCDGYGYDKAGEDDPDTPDCERCEGQGRIEVDPATYFKEERGARVVLPLYVYEHSGITMSAGSAIETLTEEDIRSTNRFIGDAAGWDTSFVGFTFDTPETLKETMGENVSDEDIAKALKEDVEVYASYLEGDVTCYSVEDDETGFYDSCGGFVGGNGEYAKEECYSGLETAIEKRLAENAERAEWAARDTITS